MAARGRARGAYQHRCDCRDDGGQQEPPGQPQAPAAYHDGDAGGGEEYGTELRQRTEPVAEGSRQCHDRLEQVMLGQSHVHVVQGGHQRGTDEDDQSNDEAQRVRSPTYVNGLRQRLDEDVLSRRRTGLRRRYRAACTTGLARTARGLARTGLARTGGWPGPACSGSPVRSVVATRLPSGLFYWIWSMSTRRGRGSSTTNHAPVGRGRGGRLSQRGERL